MGNRVRLWNSLVLPRTVLLLLTIGISEGLNKSGIVRYEKVLYEDLFKDYNKEIRPVLNQSEAVHVTFGFALSEILDVDEKNQVLTTNVWVRQTWKDKWLRWDASLYDNITAIRIDPSHIWKPDIQLYNNNNTKAWYGETAITWKDISLTWNSSLYGNIKSINVDAERVWVPDVVLYNNVNNNDHGEQYLFNTKVTISHDGTVAWYSPNKFKTSCKIDVRLFPFDTQECKATFGSWTFAGDKLDLYFYKNASRVDLRTFSKNGEWDLMSAEGVRNVIKYECCPAPYIDLTYNFVIRRRPLFYMNNLVLPCILLALLTAVSFLFPPETGERISLVITVLLGMTVFMIVFTEAIPATSEVTPLIGKYFAAVLFEVAFSLLATCVPLRLQHLHPGTEMPRWFKILIFDYIGFVMCFKCSRTPKGKKRDSQSGKTIKIRSYTNDDIKLSDTDIIENGYVKDSVKDNAKTQQHSVLARANGFETIPKETFNDNSVVNEYIKKKEREDEIYAEWKDAICILDRLFFWLYIITFVLSSLIILYGYSRS